MSEVKKTLVKSNCNCGKDQVILELGFSLDHKHAEIFNGFGFKVKDSYLKSGMLCIDNENLKAIGPIGSNRLQIMCKNTGCLVNTDKLIEILKSL
jgi:hypothetical protein